MGHIGGSLIVTVAYCWTRIIRIYRLVDFLVFYIPVSIGDTYCIHYIVYYIGKKYQAHLQV